MLANSCLVWCFFACRQRELVAKALCVVVFCGDGRHLNTVPREMTCRNEHCELEFYIHASNLRRIWWVQDEISTPPPKTDCSGCVSRGFLQFLQILPPDAKLRYDRILPLPCELTVHLSTLCSLSSLTASLDNLCVGPVAQSV